MAGERGGPAPARPERGAIFVVSERVTGARGPVAALVSTAGWATAARRVLGDAWIVTPDGVVSPEEASTLGTGPVLRTSSEPRLAARLPTAAKTLVKDLRSWRCRRRSSVSVSGPWDGADVAFVWQRHELFDTAGVRLARALGVPSVLFVPATKVWEARQWGVRRPGWATLLERAGERPALRGADLVACGSDAVAAEVRRLGVPASRILLTPTGVDLDRFDGHADGSAVRDRYSLDGRFVVGWVGSFRRFHAVEQAVEAAAGLEGVTLLLVGDGPERPATETLARRLGVHAVFTGTVPHAELPRHLAAMDAALVVARADRSFHYSPLKLAEYLAAGVPVVAPRLGQISERLTDGVDGVLVDPGAPSAIADALCALRDDPSLRRRLADGARRTATTDFSWDAQVAQLEAVVGASA